MQYSLGIDAGGTYTDAVLVRNTDGVIVNSNKALTYPDLHPDIKNVIDGLKPRIPEKHKACFGFHNILSESTEKNLRVL
jgi:N-methylhydantoinase A/oxoprolinase/acetone carboxylase beta subunit